MLSSCGISSFNDGVLDSRESVYISSDEISSFIHGFLDFEWSKLSMCRISCFGDRSFESGSSVLSNGGISSFSDGSLDLRDSVVSKCIRPSTGSS